MKVTLHEKGGAIAPVAPPLDPPLVWYGACARSIIIQHTHNVDVYNLACEGIIGCGSLDPAPFLHAQGEKKGLISTVCACVTLIS